MPCRASRPDRGQRPFPVPRPRRRARRRPRRHRHRAQGRDLSRSRRRSRRGRRRRRSTGSRSASSGKCISLLKDAGVTQAVMAGQVKHTKLFADIVPDLTLARRADAPQGEEHRRAHLRRRRRAARRTASSCSTRRRFSRRCWRATGVLTRRAPTDDEQRDLEFGYRDRRRDRRAGHRPDDRREVRARSSRSRRWKGPTR